MKLFRSCCLLVVTILLSVLLVQSSEALETPWQSSPEGEGNIRFLVGKYDVEKAELITAIHIKLSKKWKTYWKYPGDSGMPVTISLESSTNVGDVQVLWPAPKRFVFYGLESWGYEKEVIIPMKIKIKNPELPVKLDANVKWAICDEICLFEDNKFNLGVVKDYLYQDILAQILGAVSKQPKEINSQYEIKLDELTAYQDVIYSKFTSTEKFPPNLDLFIADTEENFKFPKPEITFSEDGKTVEVKSKYLKLLKSAKISESNLDFTLANGQKSISFKRVIKKIVPEKLIKEEVKTANKFNKPEKTEAVKIIPKEEMEIIDNSSSLDFKNISLITALLFALLGGLILNIMPCVLPVLSIKMMSVLKHDASDLAYTRKSFIYTILGILFSFLMLAGITIGLKSFGNTVGWGLQFQQPAFLIFLIVILVLFTANMFGFFEILLPSKASNTLNEIIDKKGDATPLGSFLTGAFATLMATPCTAPFLSTAVTFALTAQTWLILLIFLFIGLGLATPYILVALFPAIAKSFPKPGQWMSKIKNFLGVLLIGTILWLLWVFFANSGPIASLVLAFITASLYTFIWFAHKFSLPRKKAIMATIYIIIIGFVVPLYFANIVGKTREHISTWEKFSEPRLQQLIDDGQTVFIDITAEWCLTCQFNKVRATNPMEPFMKEKGVVLMIGDYTVPSKEIDDFLAKNNVYGIPYNIVYGPKAKRGIKLPEVLTQNAIRKAVLDAKGEEI